ncbi:hypothetical protein ACWENR_25775, partial [Micromonospora sp. NPDC004336]
MPLAYPHPARRPAAPEAVVLVAVALLLLAGATGRVPAPAVVALAGAARPSCSTTSPWPRSATCGG